MESVVREEDVDLVDRGDEGECFIVRGDLLGPPGAPGDPVRTIDRPGARPETRPLGDEERIRYVNGFLKWIDRAVGEGLDVRRLLPVEPDGQRRVGAGFSKKYGIVKLDFSTLERIPKRCAHWYRDLIDEHRILSLQETVTVPAGG
ncbi:family 1 glycosylhydrolase [Leifsonia sp. NPDC058292]|uniref:family 1 glycosylhydrolase n=1 Tax=Leifsonia sp. NPDC058292 TaxID=3346428 RepID=UPI0036DEC163